MTWEENHKERIEIHRLANVIHEVKVRLTGECFGYDYDDECTCYRQAMEHYIAYGMAADTTETLEARPELRNNDLLA